jgi:PmbA protein
MPLKKLSKSILEKTRKLGAGEAEVFMTSSKSTSVEVLNKKIESIDIKRETGIGLRVFKDERLGFAYTTDMSAHSVESIIAQAVANSQNSEKDQYNQLPHPKEQKKALEIFDGTISKLSNDQKVKFALDIEASAYAFDRRIKKTEKTVYQDSEVEVFIQNSNGIDANFRENLCGGHIEIISEDGELVENGYHSKFIRRLKDFDSKEIGEKAAKQAIELLGAKSISSQKLDLVMSPRIAAQFLDAASSLFSSDFVQKGKSALKGKIGAGIASDIVTLIDDGTLNSGIATSPYDSEGTPTQETILIADGTLKGFLYNNYTALKDKTSSTGNAVRGGFAGTPTVSTTNLYIKAGETSPDEIISGVKKGLYITRVMGMHTVNPISADFSVGAAGILIENGKKTKAVRGITIAGNLIEILKAIKAVGSNLEFQAGTGSPTLLIPGISVSGS